MATKEDMSNRVLVFLFYNKNNTIDVYLDYSKERFEFLKSLIFYIQKDRIHDNILLALLYKLVFVEDLKIPTTWQKFISDLFYQTIEYYGIDAYKLLSKSNQMYILRTIPVLPKMKEFRKHPHEFIRDIRNHTNIWTLSTQLIEVVHSVEKGYCILFQMGINYGRFYKEANVLLRQHYESDEPQEKKLILYCFPVSRKIWSFYFQDNTYYSPFLITPALDTFDNGNLNICCCSKCVLEVNISFDKQHSSESIDNSKSHVQTTFEPT